jgi:hypothetical protein
MNILCKFQAIRAERLFIGFSEVRGIYLFRIRLLDLAIYCISPLDYFKNWLCYNRLPFKIYVMGYRAQGHWNEKMSLN